MIFPLLMVVAIAVFMYFAGYGATAATLFSNLATVLVIAIAMTYIVFIDSKHRWPGVPLGERFHRVMTFYRG